MSRDRTGSEWPSAQSKSVCVLFWFGQLPIMVFTFGLMLCVGLMNGGVMMNYALLLSLPVLGITLSFVALHLTTSTFHRRTACNTILILSLLVNVVYLYFLIDVTGGKHSPFVHLYLYLPAVVCMISPLAKWPEACASAFVFTCYILNILRGSQPIPSWDRFNSTLWFQVFEIVFIGSILILLYLVNDRARKEPKEPEEDRKLQAEEIFINVNDLV